MSIVYDRRVNVRQRELVSSAINSDHGAVQGRLQTGPVTDVDCDHFFRVFLRLGVPADVEVRRSLLRVDLAHEVMQRGVRVLDFPRVVSPHGARLGSQLQRESHAYTIKKVSKQSD